MNGRKVIVKTGTKKENMRIHQKENHLVVSGDFSLMNLLNDKVNGKQLEHQMLNIWRVAKAYSNFYGSPYSVPCRLGLSGTPLNEAFVCLHKIIPQFQKQNKVQKVQCIVLTDGEASHLSRHVDGSTSLGDRTLYGNSSVVWWC